MEFQIVMKRRKKTHQPTYICYLFLFLCISKFCWEMIYNGSKYL